MDKKKYSSTKVGMAKPNFLPAAKKSRYGICKRV